MPVENHVASPEAQCLGKRGYGSKQEAKRAHKRLLAFGRPDDMNLYRCPHCWLWHFGHPPWTPRGRI
jgi:hypothetical protein